MGPSELQSDERGLGHAFEARSREPGRRCVLLFTRGAASECRRKKLARFERLFERFREELEHAARSLGGIDLVVASDAPAREVRTERVLRQRGATFAERVENALADAAALGYEETVVVAGDVPALDRALLAEAFAALASGRCALGPSPDGGVYLIALCASARGLLAGVPWRTARVLDALRARLGNPVLLASRADLDSRAGARALARDPRLDASTRALLLLALAPPVREPRAVSRETPLARRVVLLPARGPPARTLLAR